MSKAVVNGGALASESEAMAIRTAEKLDLPYVDLSAYRVDPELFRSIPVEWMLRYGFIPEKRTEKSLTIVCSDPTDVVKLDELELLAGLSLKLKVGSRAAITEILQKSESSQRVLDEATEEFRMQLVSEDEEGEETLTIDRITQDASPIIKLVNSIVFNAIQRRVAVFATKTNTLLSLFSEKPERSVPASFGWPTLQLNHGGSSCQLTV